MGIKLGTLQGYRKAIGTLCDSKQYGGNNNRQVDDGKERRLYNRAVNSWDGETFELTGKRFDANGSLFDNSVSKIQKPQDFLEEFNFEFDSYTPQAYTTSKNKTNTTIQSRKSQGRNTSVSKGFSNKYDAKIEQYANKYGIDPNRVKALIMNESGFNPNAVSSTSDYGLMQLNSRYFKGNLTDIDNNLDQGCKYFAQCLNTFGGDYDKALLAYNRGIGGAKSYLKTHSASDATYVQRVNGYYSQLNQNKNLRITA